MKKPHAGSKPGKVDRASALRDPGRLKTEITVLHIDDDPNDTALLAAATRKAGVPFVLHNVEDAEHAIAYLDGHGKYADRQTYNIPGLVLLDLKMPRTTGFEMLHWIRKHPQLNHLPVVVLSGSELQDDIQQAYNSGANSYLVKPLAFDALVQMVKSLSSAWLTPVPPGTNRSAPRAG